MREDFISKKEFRSTTATWLLSSRSCPMIRVKKCRNFANYFLALRPRVNSFARMTIKTLIFVRFVKTDFQHSLIFLEEGIIFFTWTICGGSVSGSGAQDFNFQRVINQIAQQWQHKTQSVFPFDKYDMAWYIQFQIDSTQGPQAGKICQCCSQRHWKRKNSAKTFFPLFSPFLFYKSLKTSLQWCMLTGHFHVGNPLKTQAQASNSFA